MRPSINAQSDTRQVVIVIARTQTHGTNFARADSSRLVKEIREHGMCAHEGEEEDVRFVLANPFPSFSR